jgi:hypothetical protein
MAMTHVDTPTRTANAKKPAAPISTGAGVEETIGATSHRVQTTTARAEAADCSGILPEFGRFQDVQRLFALKRGFTYQLINAGKIKSVSLRKPGSKFGCRLIHLQSVRDYLHSQMDSNNGKAGATR